MEVTYAVIGHIWVMLSGFVGEPAKVQHGKEDVRTDALDPDEGAYQLHE